VAFEGLDTPDPEELGEAFSRINRLGVRLDGADLFFSALKLQWPEAHNFVWSVYEDQQTGKLLTPPQIIHAAVRLAIADHRHSAPNTRTNDRLGLDLSDARPLLDKTSPSSIGDELDRLIRPAPTHLECLGARIHNPESAIGDQSPLHIVFRRLRKTLQYRELSDNTIDTDQLGCDRRCEHDIGLPLPLVARLGEQKPHILHNLLLWLHHYPDSDTLEQGLRRRIILTP
jgi:hypothetical protein